MTKRGRFKFGIGAIFFAMVVVAGYFWGVNRGDKVRQDTSLSSVAYSVRNLLTGEKSPDVELSEISNLVTSTVAPDSWIERGGMASLQTYPSNQSIVVTQYATQHEKIFRLLDSLERVAKEKRYSVYYDVSEILATEIEQATQEQLETLCDATKQAMMDSGSEEFKITPSSDGGSVQVLARKSVHAMISTYYERLRSAREVFARIDE